MPDIQRAIAHLEDAEATIMSWWQRIDSEDDDEFTTFSMLAAVLRSVSRAAGALEQSEPVLYCSAEPIDRGGTADD